MSEPDPELDGKVRKALRRVAPTGAGPVMPYGRFIAMLTLLILACFAGVSLIVLLNAYDATMKGSIIQTWNNLAVAAATFWVGSSIAGKLTGKQP